MFKSNEKLLAAHPGEKAEGGDAIAARSERAGRIGKNTLIIVKNPDL